MTRRATNLLQPTHATEVTWHAAIRRNYIAMISSPKPATATIGCDQGPASPAGRARIGPTRVGRDDKERLRPMLTTADL